MQPDNNPSSPNPQSGNDPAMNLIRQKISSLYAKEPDPKEEITEATIAGRHRSKHQDYIYHLTTSGKSLAEIQTQWHSYYQGLPDDEKHAVWQEFYDMHNQAINVQETPSQSTALNKPSTMRTETQTLKKKADPRSVADVKDQLLSKIGARGKLSKRHHIQSILFGLSTGAIVIVILLFSFFNERFVAPFITPSREVSNTPIIIDPNSTVATGEPKVIIPKINVEIPVVYDQTSISEAAIQGSLEQGVVHYATTASPGEKGNSVIFGHSSNNIFNKGKYKFAFVLLNRMEVGDTFSLTKDGKQYVYKVFQKKVVEPTDISVLNNINDKVATATLITCDPPGTSLRRLIVIGEQISPDPTTDAESTAIKSDQKPAIVPSNAPSLWHRFTTWISS